MLAAVNVLISSGEEYLFEILSLQLFQRVF